MNIVIVIDPDAPFGLLAVSFYNRRSFQLKIASETYVNIYDTFLMSKGVSKIKNSHQSTASLKTGKDFTKLLNFCTASVEISFKIFI